MLISVDKLSIHFYEDIEKMEHTLAELKKLEQAIEEAINYTHNNCLAGLESTICRMVVYNYNRISTEGVDSESYSGVTYNYSADYPENIMRVLKAHRKIRTLW